MKIALLYICTGKYIRFWDDFFRSCETHFVKSANKDYFVFTDAPTILHEENGNTHRIPQEKLGWPYDTLMRFHMFAKIKKQLAEFDFIFFFNANAQFVADIEAREILPDLKNDHGLVSVLHPGYYLKEIKCLPYEKVQRESTAYISSKRLSLRNVGDRLSLIKTHYFQGCLSGGTASRYIKLIEQLRDNVQTDLNNEIIAVWHDESHLNKYLMTHRCKILSPAYAYPEGWTMPFSPKILMRDKARLGGHDFLRAF